MINRTLFETFRLIQTNHNELSDNGTNSYYIQSIQEHLKNILNTRRGSVLIADNYGMPDLTNFPGDSLSDAIPELEKTMKITIERYEPRIKNVKVNYNPDTSNTLNLKFGLSAELVLANRQSKQPIFFETVITSDGFIRVER